MGGGGGWWRGEGERRRWRVEGKGEEWRGESRTLHTDPQPDEPHNTHDMALGTFPSPVLLFVYPLTSHSEQLHHWYINPQLY